eukprot:SAG11_NODE_674_length_7801_cov_3.578032_7_plen_294_part_00
MLHVCYRTPLADVFRMVNEFAATNPNVTGVSESIYAVNDADAHADNADLAAQNYHDLCCASCKREHEQAVVAAEAGESRDNWVDPPAAGFDCILIHGAGQDLSRDQADGILGSVVGEHPAGWCREDPNANGQTANGWCGDGRAQSTPRGPEFIRKYWGKVEDWTSNCRTHIFNLFETQKLGWNDDRQQNKLCEILTDTAPGRDRPMTPSANNVARNKVIFGHSQGNLYIAKALKDGDCALDPASTRWYMSNPPQAGSPLISTLIVSTAGYSPLQPPRLPLIELQRIARCAARG